MKPLPRGLSAYKRTATFTEETLPAGLQGEHRTRAGVWGLIHVLRGEVLYRILPAGEDPEHTGADGPSAPPEEHLLRPESPGVVEPTVPHQLVLCGPVELYVEFHR